LILQSQEEIPSFRQLVKFIPFNLGLRHQHRGHGHTDGIQNMLLFDYSQEARDAIVPSVVKCIPFIFPILGHAATTKGRSRNTYTNNT